MTVLLAVGAFYFVVGAGFCAYGIYRLLRKED